MSGAQNKAYTNNLLQHYSEIVKYGFEPTQLLRDLNTKFETEE